ncbi:MAG: hypothetical protein PF961_11050 [Planctomycetota bacterium]|jgi:hypothetical protein|nr:hypothetical protein [Planctomycetota bacterium]
MKGLAALSVVGLLVVLSISGGLVAQAWHRCTRMPPIEVAAATIIAADLQPWLHDGKALGGGTWHVRNVEGRREIEYHRRRDGQAIDCVWIKEIDDLRAATSAEAYWIGQVAPYESIAGVSFERFQLPTMCTSMATRVTAPNAPTTILAVANKGQHLLSLNLAGFDTIDPKELARLIERRLE